MSAGGYIPWHVLDEALPGEAVAYLWLSGVGEGWMTALELAEHCHCSVGVIDQRVSGLVERGAVMSALGLECEQVYQATWPAPEPGGQ